MSSSELLRIRGLSSAWGRTRVLEDVSLDVDDGEFVVLMGPNGSGKTTLLRTIAGLEPPVAGTITLRGRSLENVPTHRRGIGMLFQEPGLFPNRTVYENIAYGLDLQRRTEADILARVDALLGALRLRGLEARYPHQLSGGERQRTALARALAPGPEVLLLDEPFASVDPELRRELRGEFRRALRSMGTAAIHVTHDRDEGLFLGDRVLLLLGGRVRQAGSPTEVYEHPRTAEVARFLGYNVLQTPAGLEAVAPEWMELSRESSGGIPVELVAHGWSAGGEAVHARTEEGSLVEIRVGAALEGAAIGERLWLRWRRSIPVRAGSP